MNSPIQWISVLLLISSMTACTVSVILLNKAQGYIRSFALLLLAVALWSFGYGMELSSTSLSSALWWTRVEYIGISLIPAIWMVFILKFSGLYHRIPGRGYLVIFFLPLITLLLAWTTPVHGLLYQEVNMVEQAGVLLLKLSPGIWYHVHTVFFYLALVTGVGLIFQTKHAGVLYRRQRTIIVFAVGFPWLINMFYLSRFRPYEHLDLTPLAFLATMAVIGIGLYRYRLMDLLPLARTKVLQSMQEGVLILDNDLKISDYNQAAIQLLSAIYPISYGMRLAGTDDLSSLVGKLINDSEESQRLQAKDIMGEKKWLSFSLSFIWQEGQTEGYLVLIRDISKQIAYLEEINEKSEELKQLNTYKDQLFSIIAHDLKGPISRLVALLDLLDKQALSVEQITPLIGQVRQESTSTYNMLENLLYWSRSQFQGMQVNPRKFQPFRIVSVLLENEISRIKEKNISLSNCIAKDQLVYADEDMFTIVFRNLISNAIKFSRHSGQITVSSTTKESSIELRVQDNGVGMDQNTLKQLFSTTLKSSRGTNHEKGTGVGLQLCCHLVELNLGSIRVESKVNEGTCVYVTLPY